MTNLTVYSTTTGESRNGCLRSVRLEEIGSRLHSFLSGDTFGFFHDEADHSPPWSADVVKSLLLRIRVFVTWCLSTRSLNLYLTIAGNMRIPGKFLQQVVVHTKLCYSLSHYVL